MTENDSFEIIKNEETGAEIYQCTICSSKYGTKKAIRTHVTTKHKSKKKNDEKNETAKEDDFVYEPIDEQDEVVDVDIEEIARFYESGNNEYLDGPDDDKHEEEVTPSQAVPIDITNETESDLVEKLMSELSDTNKDTKTSNEVEDLFTENVLLKSKLKSVEDTLKEKENRILELETNLIDSNTEISKLKEEKETLEDAAKIKDEENDLLVGKKNSLEENVVRFNGIMKKMYSERTVMKSIIDKQKNTSEIAKDHSDDPDGLAAKLSAKMKELEQANSDKRRLAKDLATAQSKGNGDEERDADVDKCTKLTNLLKNKNLEAKKANDEAKKLTKTNKVLQDNLKKANNNIVSLEAKATRLEKQVEDLIDTFGQAPSEVANGKKVSFVNKETAKSSKKCSFNDKGRCREGPDCHYQHSNVVCKSFSKHGSCDNYDDCLLRHPTGICLHWKKGHCNKDDMCF